VQRLDPPIHDLGEAGEVGDRADLDAGLLQLARRAAGGDDLDPELAQALGELDDAGLVRHRDQRPRDLHLSGLGEMALGHGLLHVGEITGR
jgi:hypothetical protein